MDVIESLKRKTEESGDPAAELSEEDTDEMEEKPDPTSATNDTAAEMSEKNDMKEDLQSPPANAKPKQGGKRMKVDKDGEKKRILTENPDVPDADTEIEQIQSGVPENGKDLSNDNDSLVKQSSGVRSPANVKPKRTSKWMKVDKDGDPTCATNDTAAQMSGKNDMREDLQNPTANDKPKRSSKRMKVDRDSEENKTSTDSPDDPDADTEGDSPSSTLHLQSSEGDIE